MKRFALSLMAVSIAIVASSCAVTSPATNVSTTSATLNGKGFTTDQPGEYEFQYAVDFKSDLGTSRDFTTPRRTVPANTPPSGEFTNFSEPVTGLEPGTLYWFRLCGREGSASADKCLNEYSFRTTSVPDTDQAAFGTPGSSSFTVPAGVTRINVDVLGAEGGQGWGQQTSGDTFGLVGAGGPGGRAQARLAVTPGQQLTVTVGGRGGNANVGSGGAAGVNGGGAGGDGAGTGGGGGGGASDVRTGPGLSTRLVVAGGGGGGAGNYPGSASDPRGTTFTPSQGGGGTGGPFGRAGSPAFPSNSFDNQGRGGSSSAGGSGGLGNSIMGTEPGADGMSGTGGAGATLVERVGTAGDNLWGVSLAGAGGGGGWYGGGGGGAGAKVQYAPNTEGTEPGGAGGGGSGFITSAAVGSNRFESGARVGNGRVVLSWVAP